MRRAKRKVEIHPYRYYNIKRIEQVENTQSRTVSTYSEAAEVDIRGMHKLKDLKMINMLIDLLPESTTKEFLFLILEADRKNIVIDTTKQKQSVTKFLSERLNVSEEAVRIAIRYFTKEGWIKRLNKHQYIANPYYIVRNDLSTKRISELQKYWDSIEKDNIKTPIEWDNKDSDELLKQDLTKIQQNISKRQEEVKQNKALKAQQLKDDLSTVQSNLEQFKRVFEAFLVYNKYTTIDTKVKVHFKSWLLKGYKNNYPQMADLPELYLTSIKPINLLIKEQK